jgi:hypothetical protein
MELSRILTILGIVGICLSIARISGILAHFYVYLPVLEVAFFFFVSVFLLYLAKRVG